MDGQTSGANPEWRVFKSAKPSRARCRNYSCIQGDPSAEEIVAGSRLPPAACRCDDDAYCARVAAGSFHVPTQVCRLMAIHDAAGCSAEGRIHTALSPVDVLCCRCHAGCRGGAVCWRGYLPSALPVAAQRKRRRAQVLPGGAGPGQRHLQCEGGAAVRQPERQERGGDRLQALAANHTGRASLPHAAAAYPPPCRSTWRLPAPCPPSPAWRTSAATSPPPSLPLPRRPRQREAPVLRRRSWTAARLGSARILSPCRAELCRLGRWQAAEARTTLSCSGSPLAGPQQGSRPGCFSAWRAAQPLPSPQGLPSPQRTGRPTASPCALPSTSLRCSSTLVRRLMLGPLGHRRGEKGGFRVVLLLADQPPSLLTPYTQCSGPCPSTPAAARRRPSSSRRAACRSSTRAPTPARAPSPPAPGRSGVPCSHSHRCSLWA